jgi:predicted TIM-barrel fold metal-dependent hydrolase
MMTRLTSTCACCPTLSRRGFLASAAAAAGASLATPAFAQSKAPYRIDVHHHIFPREVMDLQEKLNPKWGKLDMPRGLPQWTPQMMRDDMDKNGVQTAMISNSGPGSWYGDVAGSRQISRAWNEYAAGLKRDNPKRVGIFAMIALPDVEGSLAEIAYAFDVLKLDGVAIYTSYDRKYAGDPAFAPVFDELNRRKATVFVHPVACCGALVPGVPTNAYELPFDTTRAVASLLFSGTFSRRPDIKFIFSHGGGAIPMLAGRIDDLTRSYKALRENVPDGFEKQLRTIYVDTAGAFHKGAMAASLAVLPADHILYGSDFPYSSSAEAVAGLKANGGTPSILAGIESRNARKLFPSLRA